MSTEIARPLDALIHRMDREILQCDDELRELRQTRMRALLGWVDRCEDAGHWLVVSRIRSLPPTLRDDCRRTIGEYQQREAKLLDAIDEFTIIREAARRLSQS